MAKYTLVVRPDGKAILAGEHTLTAEEMQQMGKAFRHWRDTVNDVLVIGDTTVITVLGVNLELPDGTKLS